MRSWRWIIGVAQAASMLTGLTGTSSAAKVSLGGGVGAAFPSGDFGDVFNSGIDGGVFADFWLNEQFALGLDVAGDWHNAKDEINDQLNAFTEEFLLDSGATTADSNLEIKASILRFGARASLAVPTGTRVSPFFRAGIGAYRIEQKLEGTVTADGASQSVDESDDDTKMGINGAAGLRFEVSPGTSLGLQGQIHNVFTEDESTQYFGFHALVSFDFGGGS